MSLLEDKEEKQHDSNILNTNNATADAVTIACVSLVVLICVAIAYHRLKRERNGTKMTHGIYAIVTLLVIVACPTWIAHYIFSGLTVTVVGTVFPIYESIRAICTPEEEDDKDWLQYWMAGGIVFIFTEWVDDALGKTSTSVIYWYEIAFFFFLWLFFPKTDGATLIYDYVTEPFLGPKIKPLQMKLNNWIKAAYQLMINATHLWVVSIFFVFLPAGLKRIVAVAVGTVYPFVSSMTAAATEEVEDDTYWLTYWSVYGILFLLMDIMETWLGWIPGFYAFIICATVYLMLPMFHGSDKIFRKVLVPLAGLQEMLILRDAIMVKKTMLRDLEPERAEAVRQAIAEYYRSGSSDNPEVDPGVLKHEFKTTYKKFSLPSLRNRFKRMTTGGGTGNSSGGGGTTNDENGEGEQAPPTETTNLLV